MTSFLFHNDLFAQGAFELSSQPVLEAGRMEAVTLVTVEFGHHVARVVFLKTNRACLRKATTQPTLSLIEPLSLN